jgi:hypothetical protein
VRVSAQNCKRGQFPGTAVNLSVATLLGTGLGMEGQRRREMAGLRTNKLVAIGANLCDLRSPHSAASSSPGSSDETSETLRIDAVSSVKMEPRQTQGSTKCSNLGPACDSRTGYCSSSYATLGERREKGNPMTDDALLSGPRRKLLAGLGAAAIGGVTGRAVGPECAQTSKSSAVVPSILAFDVNESLLDIRHLAPLFERLFGETIGIPSSSSTLKQYPWQGGPTYHSLICRRPC